MMYGASSGRKRRHITSARANMEKGSVAKSLKTSLEFNYAPLHDTLVQLSKANNISQITLETKKGKKSTSDIRWSRPAILAIASILEMKVRKLLETSVIIMGSGSSTLTSKTLKKSLLIIGDHQGMADKTENDDHALILKYIDEKNSTGPISGSAKRDLINQEKALNDKQWDDKDNLLMLAYRIFTPRVLDYLFAATNVRRASRVNVRRSLTRYALNLLGNMMRHLHAILTFAKRCTVTVKDVSAANDQNGAPLLGFESIVKKRPNIRKSEIAMKASVKRRENTIARNAQQAQLVAQMTATPGLGNSNLAAALGTQV